MQMLIRTNSFSCIFFCYFMCLESYFLYATNFRIKKILGKKLTSLSEKSLKFFKGTLYKIKDTPTKNANDIFSVFINV